MADSANVKEKTNIASDSLITRSENMVPITRGVSCALASCTTNNNEEHRKTMNVNMAPASAPNTVRAASVFMLVPQPTVSSTQCTTRTAKIAATMATAGQTQIEFCT